jgi:hypothetical protein
VTGPAHPYPGSDPGRQAAALPGHCGPCAEFGHVRVHPGAPCANVGCYLAHPAGLQFDYAVIHPGRKTPRRHRRRWQQAGWTVMPDPEGRCPHGVPCPNCTPGGAPDPGSQL